MAEAWCGWCGWWVARLVDDDREVVEDVVEGSGGLRDHPKLDGASKVERRHHQHLRCGGEGGSEGAWGVRRGEARKSPVGSGRGTSSRR